MKSKEVRMQKIVMIDLDALEAEAESYEAGTSSGGL